jgi:glucosamine--fructose-6-phosphate aminotransferase (isomerizing)
MCGIFGYVGARNTAADITLEGLKRLEYRGYDSWGVAVAKDNTIVVKKKAGKIGDATVDDMPESTLAFGHTRWATHGGVTDVNAHPHLDCTGEVAVIHNGIFENYEEVKKRLVKQGHRFISETDTEVIAHLIEEYRKRMMFSKAMQKTFNEMEGLNAVIAIDIKTGQMIAVRNGSPLVVGFGNKENYLASDASALLPHTKQVHFLEDNELAIVGANAIMLFDVKTGERRQPRKQRLTWSLAQAEKGKYPYFMLKEIHEQPGLVSEIAGESSQQALEIARTLKLAHGAYITGCGTSAHASMAAAYLFSQIAKRHVNWAIGSEFSYQTDFLVPKSAVLAISQSGETMDILETIKNAKAKGATIVGLVNVVGSSLWRMSDLALPIGVGPEKGVASTKAFTGQLAHLIMLAYAMDGRVKKGAAMVGKAAKVARSMFKPEQIERIKTLARKLKKVDHIYVVGRGLSYPASLETALKVKEISYIHAEGFAAGELKHGVIALVEKGTPCIVYAPDDEMYGANLAGAMELKARGGYVIGISHKPAEVFDYYIPVPSAGAATIIPNVIVGQLLAYYLTIERGLDPDMPRNLAKSVTVK